MSMNHLLDLSNAEPNDIPSLGWLRITHSNLLQLRREQGETPQLLDKLEIFIKQAVKIGAVLPLDDDERRTNQHVLDYWADILYRASRTPPDATLVDFDPECVPQLPDELCPYQGLDAFQPEHYRFFHGRQRLIDFLVGKIKEGHRLLAVVGPSGSGKSSLVLAGLWPTLKTGALPGSQDWCHYSMMPGSDPLESLVRLLQRRDLHDVEQLQQQVERFRQNTDELTRLVDQQSDQPVVLIVDQFEEIFTLCNVDADRQAFVDNLVGLVQTTKAMHKVVLTMRTDFETHITRLPAFQPLFEQARVQVTPLSAGELRDAIEKPAAQVGLKFETGVVDALLKDIMSEPAALPLLQFTLLKLWEKRERNRITWQVYEQIGGGRWALAKSADEFYEKLIPEEQVTAKRILLQMVQVGEGLEVTSKRISREVLYQTGEARDRLDRVLYKLIQARLVRSTPGEMPADDQVEVAHEALVRNWPKFVDWLDEERKNKRQRLRLRIAAEEWLRLGKDESALWSGSQLDETLQYEDLDDLDKEFVNASRALCERQVMRRRQRMRALAATSIVAVVAAIAAGILGLLSYQTANQLAAELRGTTSRELAGAAISNLATDPELGTLLALQAASVTYLPDRLISAEAEASLQRAIQTLGVQRTLVGHTAAVLGVAYSPDGRRLATASADNTVKVWDIVSGTQVLALTGHTDWINSVAYSPDGQRLATASADKTVRIWDDLTGKTILTLTADAVAVNGVVFSPDGQRLVTTSAGRTTQLWDAISGTAIYTFTDRSARVPTVKNILSRLWEVFSEPQGITLTVQINQVTNIAYSPDGRRLATINADNTVSVLDILSGTQVLTLAGHTGWVNAVAYSPDGQRLATASDDKTIRLWDAVSGTATLILTGHTAAVNSVAFSPDGKRLVTAGADKMVKVWDMVTGVELFTLSGHTDSVLQVVYSPDGLYLATGSRDRTARVWYATSDQPIHTLFGHTDRVESIAYNPDGIHLATASADTTVYIWHALSETILLTLTEHTDSVNDVAYNHDGTLLATASADQSAKIWDATSGRLLQTIIGHQDVVNSVAFSPDGKYLATASGDQTARVWEVSSGVAQFTLAGHIGSVWDVTYSRDGTRLATAGRDGTARVWDVLSGSALLTLTGHTDIVYSVAFSPNGTRLATASADKTVKVWDLASGEMLLALPDLAAPVNHVGFSPDGKRLATAGADGIVKIWDALSGQELYALSGHVGAVRNLSYNSPDGNYLATAGADRTARIYTLAIDELLALARQRVTRSMTPAECLRYHIETCPAPP